jgi:transcription factor C subunit 7
MAFDSPDRCLQTSKPTSTALGIPIYAEHGELRLRLQTRVSFIKLEYLASANNTGISEWYSPAEPGTGLHPRPADANALKAHFPEIDESWSSLWYPSRKGEETEALHDRVGGFLTVFLPEVQRRFAGTHRRILLVSHAATVIILAQELLGERISFRAACCSLTVLDRKVGDAVPLVGGGWTARSLGDASHLKDGPQRDWGLEDIHFEDGKVSAIVSADLCLEFIIWFALPSHSTFSP